MSPLKTASPTAASSPSPDRLKAWQEGLDLGFPGEAPYLRGIHPSMYRSRLWSMRQYAGFGSAEESNRRYRYLLKQGVTGLSVAFDLPTQIGFDSDHQLAAGEVGRVGVAIDSLDDMVTLFKDIPLDQVSTSMTINATAIILLALYVATARRQGVPPTTLSGTTQNDILKEYLARGTFIFPPRESLRLVTDIFAYCDRELPGWNTISISGYHIREAGATAVQEIAFTFADAIAYVQSAVNAGLDVNHFGRRLSFFFCSHNNFLEEIAKFRAARRLWAKVMKERFNATHPRALQLRFHTQTAGSTLSAQQPDNNIVRVTLQALAAVLGGTQSLHCNGRDEALGLPTEESAQIALRTQQIISSETRITNTVDPVAGAFAVEQLTDRIQEEVEVLLTKIDQEGGTLASIEAGTMQRQIQESAYTAQQSIDTGKQTVVGVNKFISEETNARIEVLQIDPTTERQQIERTVKVRTKRDPNTWRKSLERVAAVARTSENLVPPIIDAVEAQATVGEISDALRGVFGEHHDRNSS